PSALPDTATPATYPLSLHDALPILDPADPLHAPRRRRRPLRREHPVGAPGPAGRARSGVRAARLRRGQLHLRRPPRRDRWATDPLTAVSVLGAGVRLWFSPDPPRARDWETHGPRRHRPPHRRAPAEGGGYAAGRPGGADLRHAGGLRAHRAPRAAPAEERPDRPGRPLRHRPRPG